MILTGAKKAQDQDTVGFWPVEDAIAAIGTATDTVALIARHQRIALGQIGKATGRLTQFLNKADGSRGIVLFDMFGDVIEVGQRIRRQDDFHCG